MENSIIDLIIRVKNGYMASKEVIESPYSKFKEEILKKLLTLKFIKKYQVDGDKIKKITIYLLYEKGQSALTDIKIYSKPGRRLYVSYKDLKSVLSGYGYSILSTPQGILTNKEAKVKKVGGELLFSLW
jgi:small subunit ribosomal protein S8